MKWLLISIVVIILGVVCIAADDSNSDYCTAQEIHQSGVKKKCIANFVNRTEYINDVQHKLLEYSGDDAAVIEFAEKYCPVTTQLVNCMTLLLNIPEECRHPQFYQWQLLNFRKLSAAARFLCHNNASALKELMQNDGFSTIAFITKNRTCMSLLNDIPMYNILPEISQVNEAYCEALDGVSTCYTTSLLRNDNQNLPRLFNNISASIRAYLGCRNNE